MKQIKELTISSITIGIIVGIIMTAANVYLGLYAGMTVSASIPSVVIGLAVYRILFKKSSIRESNIVQTMASAGESLAAGIIFTVPALILVGAWTEFKFWPTTLIAICGGILGVIFMIPLRKVFIVDSKELTYPEGVACAAVLKAGDADAVESRASIKAILHGFLLGGIFKFFSGGIGVLKGSFEAAGSFANRVFFFGSDLSPALLAVGYIVNIEVAILVFAGGFLGWLIAIPILGVPTELADLGSMDLAWALWSTKVRYLGVGAMIVGGISSIYSVRKGMSTGIRNLIDVHKKKTRTREDLSIVWIGIIFLINLAMMLFLYEKFLANFGMALFTVVIMVVLSFLFVAVSSYIVGLIGTSNNPVSGMTISALLATAILLLIFGYKGESAILATLGVAAVVCCAACTAGDCSQDLKTGNIIGASPKSQQIAEIIGILIPAFVIAPVLTLLHHAYGIGTGLKAPQATLFASITQGIFGQGALPYSMIFIGMVIGVVILLLDQNLKNKKAKFRLHLMPVAVGIYLPLTLSVPILLGGLVRYGVDRKFSKKKKTTTKESTESSDSEDGVLMGSGMIAGEAIFGVIIALFIYFKIDLSLASFVPTHVAEWVSVLLFIGLAFLLYRKALSRK